MPDLLEEAKRLSGWQMCSRCGHPLNAHELVEGDAWCDLDPVMVCTAGRLADLNAPDFHPYDLACGCVFYVPSPAIGSAF